jgi:hypothetical protein
MFRAAHRQSHRIRGRITIVFTFQLGALALSTALESRRIRLVRIFRAAKPGSTWSCLQRAEIAVAGAEAFCRFQPGAAAHGFDGAAFRTGWIDERGL